MSDSLWSHGLQHARLPCPSLTPEAYSNSCPSSQWCHPTISSTIIPFSSCLQSFLASQSFIMSQFFASGGQSVGASASASILPVNIQSWLPFSLTGLMPLHCFCYCFCTNYHESNGLKQHEFIILHFWRSEDQSWVSWGYNQGVSRAVSLLEALGENPSLTLWHLEAAHIPWLVATSLQLPLLFTHLLLWLWALLSSCEKSCNYMGPSR